MKPARTLLLSLTLMPLLAAPSLVHADSAAFSVAITLHAALKQPLAPVQLCAQDRLVELPVGANIRVDCPVTASEEAVDGVIKTSSRPGRRQLPEVLVAF